ncbi:hypothetical protein IVB44_21450 [Bradyrhizobium sp. 49]|uniref:hypothetical protein n=1 Tax=unclassified Bradyrhizobium TaxID=2631580 RepID=UPI001FF9D5A8|nr:MULTISPECIES: hypothetical protein [unclassified Bradyrhizobium]MCK1266748.1 hypothetical protein [Bradyrhizobium sp. 84]MCK1373533.1 hypothetical protein [Bradyrhizobium sp. 49]
MSDERSEDSISLSLVDGISCGLAAALLLFIIFGINISISTSNLAGSAGHGTLTKAKIELMKLEPVDIFVQVSGATASFTKSDWTTYHPSTDHIVLNAQQGTVLLIRELKSGFGELNGVQAARNKISIDLSWRSPTLPSGLIHIYRSGTDSAFSFRCQQPANHYSIIASFDVLRATLKGDCEVASTS